MLHNLPQVTQLLMFEQEFERKFAKLLRLCSYFATHALTTYDSLYLAVILPKGLEATGS